MNPFQFLSKMNKELINIKTLKFILLFLGKGVFVCVGECVIGYRGHS